jgi:hypothetical protein
MSDKAKSYPAFRGIVEMTLGDLKRQPNKEAAIALLDAKLANVRQSFIDGYKDVSEYGF